MRRNLFICAISALLTLTIILPGMSLYTAATEANTNDEEKVLCEATIEDDFSDDEILIVFKQKESLSFKDYSLDDFSDIDCTQIISLSSAIIKKAKYAIESALEDISNGKIPEITEGLDLSSFRTIICIKLKEPGKDNVLNMIKKLEKRSDIYCVCPNYSMKFDAAPDITPDEDSAYYTDPEAIYDLLGLTELWENLPSGAIINTPCIAVIDSGLDKAALEYCVIDTKSANLSEFRGEYNSSLDIPDEDLGIPAVSSGHGTHVAGIIAQVVKFPNDIALNLEFSAIRVVSQTDGNNTSASVESVIAAINYVNDLNIKIINMSGNTIIGPTGFDLSATFRTAVESYQGLIICSAGNSGRYLMTEDEDDDAYHNDIYPAALVCDNLITVGSSDMNDVKSSFSNWGAYNVDLFAPGEDILSCFPSSICIGNTCENVNGYQNSHVVNGYHSLSGTSMAAPFVTGVAALLLSINEGLTIDQLRDYILDNVDEVDTLQGLCVTGGRLNAYKAVMDLISDCNHTLTYSHSTSGHISQCTKCSYRVVYRNALYIQSESASGITVKCSECSTQLPVCNHTHQYSSGDKLYHRLICNTCKFGLNEEHNSTYINLPNEGQHSAYCDICELSFEDNHKLYGDYFDEEENLHIECSLCSYSILCPDNSFEYIDTKSHSIKCSGCDVNLVEDHNFDVTVLNNSRHRKQCRVCGYTEIEDHAYYEASWDEFLEVGCTKCSLSIDCIHVEEYDYDDTTHSIGCTSCGYEITGTHNFYRCVNTGSALYHTSYCWDCEYTKSVSHIFLYSSTDNELNHGVYCSDCGYLGTQSHTWVLTLGEYECMYCGQISSSTPSNPIASIPPKNDEELSE